LTAALRARITFWTTAALAGSGVTVGEGDAEGDALGLAEGSAVNAVPVTMKKTVSTTAHTTITRMTAAGGRSLMT